MNSTRLVTAGQITTTNGRSRLFVGPADDQRVRVIASPNGLRSTPVAGDKVIEFCTERTDSSFVLGAVQSGEDLTPGETELFGRDESGKVVSTTTLKNDGSINISSTKPVTINGIDWETHTHNSGILLKDSNQLPCTGSTGGVKRFIESEA